MSTATSLTPRQRFFNTFTGQPTDRVPIAHIGFSSHVAAIILGREAYVGGGIQQWREATSLWKGGSAHQEFLEKSAADAFDVTRATGQDLYRWEYWRMPRKPFAMRDQHTLAFGDPDGAWHVRRYDPPTEMFPIVEWGGQVEKPPQTMDDLAHQLDAMEREQPGDLSSVTQNARTLLQRHPDYAIRFHGGYVGIPYEDQVWLEAALDRPDLVHRYMEHSTQGQLRQIEALTQAGVKLLFGGGDFASNTGPFYSPSVFRDMVLPYLQRLADACHQAGAYLLFASDGNLWPVADDLFAHSGLDGYYEIDRRAGMDLNRLRDRFPHLTLVAGNISSHTLSQGTPADVIAECRDCLTTARQRGKISVGTSNYATPETPPENVRAMVDTLIAER